MTGSHSDPAEQRARFVDRLHESNVSTKRFIDVHDGAKGSTEHTQRAPDDPRLRGNYGTYGGPGADEDVRWLVDVDVDDYADTNAETAGLDSLPETFTVESPHTDGETGGHRYFAVQGNVAEAFNDRLGVKNPAPKWGEVRVSNQYCVGPGSQLDGCDKDWCDACAEPDGGYYRIADDRPIAVLELEEFVGAIVTDLPDRRDRGTRGADDNGEGARSTPRSDSEEGARGAQGVQPGPGLPDDVNVDDRLEHALEADEKLRQLWHGRFRAAGYGDDRSKAETALAGKLGWWFGQCPDTVKRLMDRANTQKWCTRTDTSYRDSILSVVGGEDFYEPSAEPSAALALKRLAALDRGQRRRYCDALPADQQVPSSEEVAADIRDAVEDVLRGEGHTVVQAPTGSNKTGAVVETTWRDVDDDVTGDQLTVMFCGTCPARNEAAKRARDAGLKVKVLRGRTELCPLCRGDHDPENVADDDDRESVVIDGLPASEWFEEMCERRGLSVSVAHAEARQKTMGELPCCPGESHCLSATQWPGGWTDRENALKYDLVIATDLFAFVPSLRTHTNVIHDERPDYSETLGLDMGEFPTHAAYLEALTSRVRGAITAFLQLSEDGPDTFEELVELARECARCDATPWNEQAAPDKRPDEELGRRWIETFSALEHEPERRWYFSERRAHTLAPALARGLWKAITGDIEPNTDPDKRGAGVFDRNGRAKATIRHNPPRLDANADETPGWNRNWVTITIDDENTIRAIRNAPDLSTARSVVGLDARPTVWLWQRNVHPDLNVERVLEPEQAKRWRRYERGQTVVGVGEATRPAGTDGRYFNERHARALIERLHDEFGEDFRAAGTAKATENQLRKVMLGAGVDSDALETMHYGDEKSRNDFEREQVGLVYGCIDPGDDYVLDLLAECGLDAAPERSEPGSCDHCEGAEGGCHKCEGTGRKRAHGRGFVGPDAEHAAELLESVRATHVAQMIGRFGRRLDVENGETNLTFVATDAVPADLVDLQVPGVKWLASELQRDIVVALRETPRATTAELADRLECTKEHVRQTLAKLEEQGVTDRRRGTGMFGADEWLSEANTAIDDVQLRLDEIANRAVYTLYTWQLAIVPPGGAVSSIDLDGPAKYINPPTTSNDVDPPDPVG